MPYKDLDKRKAASRASRLKSDMSLNELKLIMEYMNNSDSIKSTDKGSYEGTN